MFGNSADGADDVVLALVGLAGIGGMADLVNLRGLDALVGAQHQDLRKEVDGIAAKPKRIGDHGIMVITTCTS